MAREVIAYVAVSLDGFIAGDEGTVDFLEQFGSDEYGFDEFLESIGAVVMGSATYEQILGWGWPYGATPGLVLTHRALNTPGGVAITFSSETTGDAISSYAATTEQRLWIVGGGKVILDGLSDGAIDTLELYVMPVVLGSGVRLFPGSYDGPLSLTESQPYSNGVVKLVYSTKTAPDAE